MKNKVRASIAAVVLTAGIVMVPTAAQAAPTFSMSAHHTHAHKLPAWLCFLDNMFRSGPERISC